MANARTPLTVSAIYAFLLGLSTLSPSIAQTVFGYEVKDAGVLMVLSGLFIGYSIVIWSIASGADKYGGLASAQAMSLVVGIVFILWGWSRGLGGTRTYLVPLIINIVLAAWLWSAKPKS